jgi:hypothetical protein
MADDGCPDALYSVKKRKSDANSDVMVDASISRPSKASGSARTNQKSRKPDDRTAVERWTLVRLLGDL